MRHESTHEAQTDGVSSAAAAGYTAADRDAAEAGDGRGGGGPMRVGSLFSGIGGLDLGFHRAGFEIAWMCEKDEFCRKVLRKHWPNTPIYDDVNTLRNPEPVDVLIGGFPCQDISNANPERRGLDGERSGLWWAMHRLARDLRPRYVVLENVAALAVRGLDSILGALSALGYDAEWETLSACAFGAPHVRKRLFVVAYRDGFRQLQPEGCITDERRRLGDRCAEGGRRHWAAEPAVARMAHGVPYRLDRERGLGNAVVPQVAEYVARCVRQHAEARGEWGRRHDAPPMSAAV